MVQESSIEKLPKSAIKISITVGAADTKAVFDSLTAEYSRKAHIKGFRPGKTPVSVLLSKFGDSIKAEASQKIMEDSLKEVLNNAEYHALPYARPVIDSHPDFKLGEEFSYSISIDIMPEPSITQYLNLSIKQKVIEMKDSDIDAELGIIRQRNAIMVNIHEGSCQIGDTVKYERQLLNDDETENSDEPVEKLSVTLSLDDLENKDISQVLLGMNINESKVSTIEETIDDGSKKTKKQKVTLSEIKRKDLPELDDELAQDVDEKFKTLEDLKNSIKERIANDIETMQYNAKIDAYLDTLIQNNDFELPESMIEMQLYNHYQELNRKYGGDENKDLLGTLLQMQNKTPASMLEGWRPSVIQILKRQIITQALINQVNVEVSEDEKLEKYNEMANKADISVDEVMEYHKNNNMENDIEYEIKVNKLFKGILPSLTVLDGETIDYQQARNQ